MRSKITRLRTTCAQALTGLILDVGAGEGDYIPYLGNDVVSLDLDIECLKAIPGKRVVGNALELPFPNNTFDGVWSCALLEHVEVDCVPEAIRVAKRNGTIFVLTPNRNSPYDPVKRLFGLGDWWSYPGHVRLYSVSELERYGKVWGEVWWAPGLDQIARVLNWLGHTLMLRINVSLELKDRFGS